MAFDEKLAEIVGIMLGDGCLYKEKRRNRYQTVICFHKEEEEYQQYVKELFESYFNYKFCSVPLEHGYLLRNTSFLVGNDLLSAGLIAGSKVKHKVEIPSWIVENPTFLKKALRGLFDTDGCVYKKYGIYAQISFKFGCYETTNSVREGLIRLGYHPNKIGLSINPKQSCTVWKFSLSKQQEIDQFFEEFAPQNQKHLRRYVMIKGGNKIRDNGEEIKDGKEVNNNSGEILDK